MTRFRILLISALIFSATACDPKEKSTFGTLLYTTSDGDTVALQGEYVMQSFKSTNTRNDNLLNYQIEGREINSVTLRFGQSEHHQHHFTEKDISMFHLKREIGQQYEMELLSGSIVLTDDNEVLEGRFEGTFHRKWKEVNGVRQEADDTLTVSNGYFMEPITEEYVQCKKKR